MAAALGEAVQPPEGSDGHRIIVINKLPPAEVARAALVLMGLLLAAYLLWRVQDVLLLLFMAILLATAIEPLVTRLRRGPFTKGSGVLAVYTVIVICIGVPAYLLIPNVVAQAAAFSETLPEHIQSLRGSAASLEPRALGNLAASLLDDASHAIEAPQQPAQDQLVQAGATAAYTLFSLVTIFVLAFYWIVERALIKRAVLRAVPARHARNVNTVWMEVEEKLGGWVRGELLMMLAIGVMAGIGYTVIGLPNPILLGAVAALFEAVPMIGPFLAFAPAVLVGLAMDPSHAIVVAVYALVIQQIESNVLVPRVMGHTVGVSPMTVLLGILFGAALDGLPGAFLAVPVAGAVQVILAHTLRTEDPSQAEEHRPPAERAAQQGAAPTDPSAEPPEPVASGRRTPEPRHAGSLESEAT